MCSSDVTSNRYTWYLVVFRKGVAAGKDPCSKQRSRAMMLSDYFGCNDFFPFLFAYSFFEFLFLVQQCHFGEARGGIDGFQRQGKVGKVVALHLFSVTHSLFPPQYLHARNVVAKLCVKLQDKEVIFCLQVGFFHNKGKTKIKINLCIISGQCCGGFYL